jgi:hypothetical protein
MEGLMYWLVRTRRWYEGLEKGCVLSEHWVEGDAADDGTWSEFLVLEAMMLPTQWQL